MTWEWVSYLGIQPPLMFAGFCGGIVNIFYFHRTKPRELVGAIICGTFVANFMSGVISHYVGMNESLLSAFVIGWFGLKWVASVILKRKPGLLFQADPEENNHGS